MPALLLLDVPQARRRRRALVSTRLARRQRLVILARVTCSPSPLAFRVWRSMISYSIVVTNDGPAAVIAALGERMLTLAGRYTDGTTTWMVGLKTLENHIIPTMHKAAAAAGRPQPRTIAGFPILLTEKPDEVRQMLATGLAVYGALPSYRAMLDREGLGGPEELAILGDEAVLTEAISSLREAGVTDFNAAIPEIDDASFNRTLEFIATV